MGLSPSEPPSNVWGPASNPDLTGGENHYQGCVASLSSSLQGVNGAHIAIQADQDCREKGLASGSPQLAECVLLSEGARRVAVAGPGTMARTQAGDRLERVSIRSYFDVGSREKTRREEFACARLGLNPAYGAFANCVKDMKDTFYSIDNPRD